MPISKVIHAIARPKIDFHFPDFSIDVANRSEVSALKPIHPGMNKVRRTTILEATDPICIGLIPLSRLVA